MATENQVNANRKNALKSTGPRTEEGKDASSQNAVKHGLCAKKNVIRTENQDEFDIYRTRMLDDLLPDGAMEEMLCERIVSLSWRLKRAEHFQNAVIDALIEHGLHGASFGFGWTSENRERVQKEAADGDMDVLLGIVINHDFANSKKLEQLLIYERRIESSLYRTIAELKKAKRLKKTEDRTQDTDDTAWAEVHPTGNCTNEANLDKNTEDGTLVAAKSPDAAGQDTKYKTQDTEETNFQVKSENNTCTNEANSLQEYRTQDTENRISQALQSNETCPNEPNLEDNSSTGLQQEMENLKSEMLSDANSATSMVPDVE